MRFSEMTIEDKRSHLDIPDGAHEVILESFEYLARGWAGDEAFERDIEPYPLPQGASDEEWDKYDAAQDAAADWIRNRSRSIKAWMENVTERRWETLGLTVRWVDPGGIDEWRAVHPGSDAITPKHSHELETWYAEQDLAPDGTYPAPEVAG